MAGLSKYHGYVYPHPLSADDSSVAETVTLEAKELAVGLSPDNPHAHEVVVLSFINRTHALMTAGFTSVELRLKS
jgi:hypothetical protein